MNSALPLENCFNIRDLGGLLTKDKRQIESHRLIRSSDLSRLTDRDLEFLAQYGLTTVIDLRSPEEVRTHPDHISSKIEYFHRSIFPSDETQTNTDIIALRKQYAIDPLAGFHNMINVYQDMVQRESSQKAFHDFFEILVAGDKKCILFHCTSGKDRTGLATVFLLSLLGISKQTIRKNYLISNSLVSAQRQERVEEARSQGASLILQATLRSLGSVSNEYLDSALVLIEEQYGGLDKYLQNQIGITPEMTIKLKRLYLS